MSESAQPTETITEIKPDLARRIHEEIGQNVYLCYQCVKCTSGCPVAEYFDWQPNQIMRALQFGQEDIALHADTPWLCSACATCTTRCPQELDVNAIMEFLTREALDRGVRPAIPEVDYFNKGFLREVRLWGRAYELGLIAELKLRNRDLMGDVDLGVRMFRKGKLRVLPAPARPPRKVKPLPEAANATAYYPGCSLHASAREYDESVRAVAEALDLNLIEPDGWQCCGSTAAHRADPTEAVRLPMENLSLIEQSGFEEVVMPCAACFNRHKAAQYEIRKHEDLKAEMDEAIGYTYRDTVQVNTLSQTILDHLGLDEVKARVQKPLHDLKVVCYYGCLLTRPPQVTGAGHPENPTDLDELMAALGADVLDWSYKTVCCGASHSLTRPDIVLNLSSNIIQHAREAGADAIAVVCPLCHTNLDARQFQMELDQPMPVLYFTQLMALALGLSPKSAALQKNLVDPQPLLRSKGLIA